MIRGILAGLFWGVVLGGGALALASLTSPLPVRPGAAVPADAPEPVAMPENADDAPDAPETSEDAPDASGDEIGGTDAGASAAEAGADGVPETAAPQPGTGVSEGETAPEPAGGQDATAEIVPEAGEPSANAAGIPVPESTPTPAEPPESAPAPAGPDAIPAPLPGTAAVQPPAGPQAMPPAGTTPPASSAEAPRPEGWTADAPSGAAADVAGAGADPVPTVPPTAGTPAALGGPPRTDAAAPVLPSGDRTPASAAPEAPAPAEEERIAEGPQILPAAPPAAERNPAPEPGATQPAEATARPQPGFSGSVDGVRTGRLPSIAAPATAPEASDPPAGALARNARPFANPDGKPPFAILLLDSAEAGVDPATLAAGDLPLTLVVDPSRPGAAERAALWRAAGQEVALLATGLPRRGNASDMEVAMETLAAQFPEALAVTDLPEDGMQADRAWPGALVPALAARGYGLVTWERGLNAAEQVARREGLPAATIFRDLDARDEAAPVIRRYLDRAAFKAQQDGRVVVVGRLRAETVTALLEWALDGRAAALALAPLSAAFPPQ